MPITRAAAAVSTAAAAVSTATVPAAIAVWILLALSSVDFERAILATNLFIYANRLVAETFDAPEK